MSSPRLDHPREPAATSPALAAAHPDIDVETLRMDAMLEVDEISSRLNAAAARIVDEATTQRIFDLEGRLAAWKRAARTWERRSNQYRRALEEATGLPSHPPKGTS